MTIAHKTEIKDLLSDFISQYPNTAQAVAQLREVSQATVIHVRDGKWDNISDAMWRNIGKQVGWILSATKARQIVETRDFKTMIFYFDLAKSESETFSIIGGSGFGKSCTGDWYANEMKGKNVFHITCAEYWTPRHFLMEILTAMGRNATGTVYDMMQVIISEMRRMDSPLLILDEIDKLDDKVLRFFITLYNKLNGLVGIVWTATQNIERRLRRGLRLGKTGYEEIFTRIGSTHIELQGTNLEEVTAICAVNNITDREEVNKLYNTYQGNLRRVRRVILKNTIKKLKKAAQS